MNDRTTGPSAEPTPPAHPAHPAHPSQASGTPGTPGPDAPVPRERRVLRAVARWTAAVAVFAAVGGAAAYGIAGMERTDVPGLATESDGRWDYPELTRPPLPSGSPGPFADGNAAGAHHADLRALVLPAPAGAREDRALRGADGWLATEDYLREYAGGQDRDELRQKLVDTGLRHIAARGWTTPDGTRTRIYLLQFDTAQVVESRIATDAAAFVTPAYPLRGAHDAVHDEEFPERAAVAGIERTAYAEPRPYGAEQVRQAHLSAGDVYAVVLQSRKGGVPAVPFQQTVVLQSQLLG
ncbi:hypothetical protein GCM10019016_043760 [Streptomyces prasinosporus]|uniref:Uncharacterized protein n=1 Tax=Streptomyces prasinosporus TaxID=68256 RepID=A0ABP6TPS6_9ACTN